MNNREEKLKSKMDSGEEKKRAEELNDTIKDEVNEIEEMKLGHLRTMFSEFSSDIWRQLTDNMTIYLFLTLSEMQPDPKAFRKQWLNNASQSVTDNYKEALPEIIESMVNAEDMPFKVSSKEYEQLFKEAFATVYENMKTTLQLDKKIDIVHNTKFPN